MKKLQNTSTIKVILVLIVIPLFYILFKFYFRRISAFGCFDDCFNYGAGYFISKGKDLYSEIFFNHQMLMAYLSAGIQNVFHPTSIYELLIAHRRVVLLFGYLFNIFLILRFGFVGFAFTLIYEPTKYYIFGDRFLAEGLIVYPLVYLFSLVYEKLQKRNIFKFDYIFAAICAWFVIFMREPYILVSLVLFGILIVRKRLQPIHYISLILFILLSLVSILSVSIKDFIFNVVTINLQTVAKDELQTNQIAGLGIVKIFLYPFYSLFAHNNIFGNILRILSIMFIGLLFYHFYQTKKKMIIFITFVILGISNIRFVEPGVMYFASFHMVPWYGLFIISVLLFSKDYYLNEIKKSVRFIPAFIVVGIFVYSFISPYSFMKESVDRNEDFIINYDPYLADSEVFKQLSSSQDRLFVDGWNEIIYVQSGMMSPYQYSWYTSVMPKIPLYVKAREDMFRKTPPEFYYGSCKESPLEGKLPNFIKDDYVNLLQDGKASCLYVKKSTLDKISNEKKESIKTYHYTIPQN